MKDSYARHDPRVVTTRAELEADLTMSGLAMVRATQNFIQEAKLHPTVSATMEEVTCLENTKWETESNEEKTTTQRRFVSSESMTGWHERGGDWTRWQLSQSDFGLLHPANAEGKRWRLETQGMKRLAKVPYQDWHADAAAEAKSFCSTPLEATPLSMMHPLTPGGTTILMVPLDLQKAVRVFVPEGHLLIWSGYLKNAGDTFEDDNVTLVTYLTYLKVERTRPMGFTEMGFTEKGFRVATDVATDASVLMCSHTTGHAEAAKRLRSWCEAEFQKTRNSGVTLGSCSGVTHMELQRGDHTLTRHHLATLTRTLTHSRTLTRTLTLTPATILSACLSTNHSPGYKVRLCVRRAYGATTSAGKHKEEMIALIMGRLVKGRKVHGKDAYELIIEVLYVDPTGRKGVLGLHLGQALVAVLATMARTAAGASTSVSLGVGLSSRDSHTSSFWHMLGLSALSGAWKSSGIEVGTLLDNVSKFMPQHSLTRKLLSQSTLSELGIAEDSEQGEEEGGDVEGWDAEAAIAVDSEEEGEGEEGGEEEGEEEGGEEEEGEEEGGEEEGEEEGGEEEEGEEEGGEEEGEEEEEGESHTPLASGSWTTSWSASLSRERLREQEEKEDQERKVHGHCLLLVEHIDEHIDIDKVMGTSCISTHHTTGIGTQSGFEHRRDDTNDPDSDTCEEQAVSTVPQEPEVLD